MTIILVLVGLCVALALVAVFLACAARKSFNNAATLLRNHIMTDKDLATHITPMMDSLKTSFADQTTLLLQIKEQNAATGQDNTLVDQAIANIDAVTAQAAAAHQAMLAASATVTLSPTSATVAANGTEQFSATASDGSTPTWSTDVGTIDANGLFTAGANPGSGTVVATLANGATASASVTVS